MDLRLVEVAMERPGRGFWTSGPSSVWPLAGLRNATFLKNEVLGVVIPDAIMERIVDGGSWMVTRATGGRLRLRDLTPALRPSILRRTGSDPRGGREAGGDRLTAHEPRARFPGSVGGSAVATTTAR